VSSDLATAPTHLTRFVALASAGFRRYATYRQATAANAFTNSVFGFLRCFVLLAALAGTGTATAGGYDRAQLATYCWVSQGLIGVILLWGWSDLGDRIRSGDVVTDLLRPVHPVASYLAIDLGRAGYAALTRFVVPIVVGAIFFDLYAPQRPVTYPLFVVSTFLAVVICFACRYLINAAGFWLLDVRGVNLVWTFGTAVLAGLAFPLHFLPAPLVWILWIGTPFPSMLQAPLDVVVERGPTPVLLGVVAGQAVWAALVLGICVYVQGRAERKLVIQGG
jgi:ABC-2 type transport system permease protein